jgi:hypothetical protein
VGLFASGALLPQLVALGHSDYMSWLFERTFDWEDVQRGRAKYDSMREAELDREFERSSRGRLSHVRRPSMYASIGCFCAAVVLGLVSLWLEGARGGAVGLPYLGSS